MVVSALYFDILCTYSQKGYKIDPAFKSRMYRMFLSFRNLETFTVETSMSMGQLLLVVAFTDGDYQRLEGEGHGFSLRDDSMDSSKNGGLSMKSCGFVGLIITNGGFSNFKD